MVRPDEKLAHLRRMYEPYVNSLARHFLAPLLAWSFKPEAIDNWQTTAWERVPARFESFGESEEANEEHSW